MSYNEKIFLDQNEARRNAVRVLSTKRRALGRFVQDNVQISEVSDVEIYRVLRHPSEMDMIGPTRMVYQAIRNQYEELDEPEEGSLVKYNKMEPVDIYDAKDAAENNRKSLAAFDAELERLMAMEATMADYMSARSVCPMTLAEYLIAEIEVCQELRPKCRTEFALRLYVSGGRETKMFTFPEDNALQIAFNVDMDVSAKEEYELAKYDIVHEHDYLLEDPDMGVTAQDLIFMAKYSVKHEDDCEDDYLLGNDYIM